MRRRRVIFVSRRVTDGNLNRRDLPNDVYVRMNIRNQFPVSMITI